MTESNKKGLSEREIKIVMITAVVSIILSVVFLHYHGYINHSTPEQGAIVQEFKLISLKPGTQYKVSSKPSGKNGICVDGKLMLQPDNGKAVVGLLVDHKDRVVSCNAEQFNQ